MSGLGFRLNRPAVRKHLLGLGMSVGLVLAVVGGIAGAQQPRPSSPGNQPLTADATRGQARAAVALSEREGPTGTYLWHHQQVGVDQVTHEALHRTWLLDTRTGAVYSHKPSDDASGLHWAVRVKKLDRTGAVGTFQWRVVHEKLRLKEEAVFTTVNLLDSRSGAVYSCRLGDKDFGMKWELVIHPRFDD